MKLLVKVRRPNRTYGSVIRFRLRHAGVWWQTVRAAKRQGTYAGMGLGR